MGKRDYSSRLQKRWNSKQEKDKRKREQAFQEFEEQLREMDRIRIGFDYDKMNPFSGRVGGVIEIKKKKGEKDALHD